MNQRGDATLLGIMLLVVLSGALLLCSLELEKSFQKLKARTQIFLCAKELKIELHQYLVFIGRTNWALANIKKAQFLTLFIPGLQLSSLKAEEIKRMIMELQKLKLLSYLKKLQSLKASSCGLSLEAYSTPHSLSGFDFLRDHRGIAQLRREEWKYQINLATYTLSLDIKFHGNSSLKRPPQIKAWERKEKWLFHSSSI